MSTGSVMFSNMKPALLPPELFLQKISTGYECCEYNMDTYKNSDPFTLMKFDPNISDPAEHESRYKASIQSCEGMSIT